MFPAHSKGEHVKTSAELAIEEEERAAEKHEAELQEAAEAAEAAAKVSPPPEPPLDPRWKVPSAPNPPNLVKPEYHRITDRPLVVVGTYSPTPRYMPPPSLNLTQKQLDLIPVQLRNKALPVDQREEVELDKVDQVDVTFKGRKLLAGGESMQRWMFSKRSRERDVFEDVDPDFLGEDANEQVDDLRIPQDDYGELDYGNDVMGAGGGLYDGP